MKYSDFINISTSFQRSSNIMFDTNFTQEPYSFQSFINKELDVESLYTLDMLFDYINYISNAYAVNMVDKESWKLANEYLDSANILTIPQQQIIKSIALISAFGLENLTLSGSQNIEQEIEELEARGLILYMQSVIHLVKIQL